MPVNFLTDWHYADKGLLVVAGNLKTPFLTSANARTSLGMAGH